MAWIRTPRLPPDHPALKAARGGLPAEYFAPPSERLPAAVRRESIVLAHALLPDVMGGIFAGFSAMLSPDSPLSRREQEMIAVVVSSINDCFY